MGIKRYVRPFKCSPGVERDAYYVMAGEYDIPWVKALPGVRILDIGANVGAFIRWAQGRFEDCIIHAYEPDPINCQYIGMNCDDVILHQAAVTTQIGTAKFYRSLLCDSMHSLIQTKDHHPTPIHVSTVHPANLPRADILKMDTEGMEVPILEHYLPTHKPSMIALEYHTEEDRIKVDEMLRRDYHLCRGAIININHGTLIYLRRDAYEDKRPEYLITPAEQDPAGGGGVPA